MTEEIANESEMKGIYFKIDDKLKTQFNIKLAKTGQKANNFFINKIQEFINEPEQ